MAIDNKIIRNSLFVLLQDESNDGYAMSLKFKDIHRQEACKELGDRLQHLGCLSNWECYGRNMIRGQIDKERVKKLIESGRYG